MIQVISYVKDRVKTANHISPSASIPADGRSPGSRTGNSNIFSQLLIHTSGIHSRRSRDSNSAQANKTLQCSCFSFPDINSSHPCAPDSMYPLLATIASRSRPREARPSTAGKVWRRVGIAHAVHVHPREVVAAIPDRELLARGDVPDGSEHDGPPVPVRCGAGGHVWPAVVVDEARPVPVVL